MPSFNSYGNPYNFTDNKTERRGQYICEQKVTEIVLCLFSYLGKFSFLDRINNDTIMGNLI